MGQIPAETFAHAMDVAFRVIGKQYPGLPGSDREDLLQNIGVAVVRTWPKFDEEIATFDQFLSGIIRLEARVFLHSRGQQAALEPLLGETFFANLWDDDPEDRQGFLRRVHDLLGQWLSDERSRNVVILRILGCTYREIAAELGMSKSEAHVELNRALDELAKKTNRQPWAALPLPLAVAVAGAEARSGAPGRPDAGLVARMWRGALDADPAHHAARRSTQTSPRVRLLHSILGLLVGLLVAGRLGSASTAPSPGDPAPIVLAETAPPGPESPNATAVTLHAAVTDSTAQKRAPAAPAVSRPANDDAGTRAESVLIDEAREALLRDDVSRAVRALREHTRRYAAGQHAAARSRLLAEACQKSSSACTL
jgi:RNA polymerase sigma factor (sigma-70 family)